MSSIDQLNHLGELTIGEITRFVCSDKFDVETMKQEFIPYKYKTYIFEWKSTEVEVTPFGAEIGLIGGLKRVTISRDSDLFDLLSRKVEEKNADTELSALKKILGLELI